MTNRTTTAHHTNTSAPLVQPRRGVRRTMSDSELHYREREARRAIMAQQRLEAEQRRWRIIMAAVAVTMVLAAMAGWLIENMTMAMAMAFSAC